VTKTFPEFLDSLERGVYVIVGNYGSGKSEISVNLAMQLGERREQVSIADLDIINPYFRCREARDVLRGQAIQVIVPPGEQLEADLPIILPQIRGAIGNPGVFLILDVGGDDLGARVLGSLSPMFEGRHVEMWMVYNKSRPFTEDAAGARRIMAEIEHSAKMKMTGVVGNTHLMEHTDAGTVLDGYRTTREIAAQLNLPIPFVAAENRLIDQLNPDDFDCPLMGIDRRLLPPWLQVQGSRPGPGIRI